MAGGSARFPVDGYHPYVHADVVFLSDEFLFVLPEEVIDVAETAPCFDQCNATYGGFVISDLGYPEPGTPNVRRPAFFRRYGRM